MSLLLDVDPRAPKKVNQHQRVGEDYRELFLRETPMPQHLRTFRQLYRMTPDCYKFMKSLIMEKTDVFCTTQDSFGTPGVVDDIKLLSALYHLASGAPFTAVGAFYDISNGSAGRFFDNFLTHGRDALSAFLAEVTPEEAVEIVAVHEKEHGLPGYLGSLDCCRWMWEMCPDSHRVAHLGKEGKPSLILEAVASRDLRVLWYSFGSPGSYNDLNVLKNSRIITRYLEGSYPEVEYELAGKKYFQPYMMVDGIYPEWSIFVKSYAFKERNKDDADEVRFNRRQEGVRKDVERLFGVLQKRFKIFRIPCNKRSKERISQTMELMLALHNMIVAWQKKTGKDDPLLEEVMEDVDSSYSEEQDEEGRPSKRTRHNAGISMEHGPTEEDEDFEDLQGTNVSYSERLKILMNKTAHLQLRQDLKCELAAQRTPK